MKKRLVLCVGMILICALLICSCGEKEKRQITVITREEGSGTRSVFCELFGLYRESEEGEKLDMTYERAEVTAKTAELLISVSLDECAIGYTSLGTLGHDVKPLRIDGVSPSPENIKNGKYSAVREFFALTKGKISDAAKDFLSFIMSKSGAGILSAGGYIAVGNDAPYSPSGARGEISISGSSSVYPIVEKLAEAYRELNPDVRIELQQSDSSSGIRDAISGTSDIGLSSRQPSAEELQEGIIQRVIALDGIAVVVNKDNPIDSLSKEDVRKIFSGEIRSWEEIGIKGSTSALN